MMKIEELMKFCDPTEMRYYLHKPFKLPDGRICASDGKIIVVVNDSIEIEPSDVPEKNLQKIYEWIAPELFNDGFAPLKIKLPVCPLCTECDGTGIQPPTIECEECAGAGELECDLGHFHDCEECDGTGKIPSRDSEAKDSPCESCGGSGKGFAVETLGDRSFQVKYLELLVGLPNIEYFLVDGKENMMRFRFDGGVGCLMPCR